MVVLMVALRGASPAQPRAALISPAASVLAPNTRKQPITNLPARRMSIVPPSNCRPKKATAITASVVASGPFNNAVIIAAKAANGSALSDGEAIKVFISAVMVADCCHPDKCRAAVWSQMRLAPAQ